MIKRKKFEEMNSSIDVSDVPFEDVETSEESTEQLEQSEQLEAEVLTVDTLPTEVAIEYKRDNFIVGQSVVVLDELTIGDDEFVDEKGHTLEKDVIKKIKDNTKKINKLIRDKKLKGKVFKIEGDLLIIDFGEQLFFTSGVYPMDQVLPDRKHFFPFSMQNCGYLDDGKENSVVTFISQIKKEPVEKLCLSYIRNKKDIIATEETINNYIKQIDGYRKQTISKNIANEILLEEIKKNETTENLDDYVAKIYKNKDVKDIKVVTYQNQSCIMVTTNPLEYNDTVGHDATRSAFKIHQDGVSTNIGEYKFLIIPGSRPRATSSTKFLGSGQHHTCVDASFTVCMGSGFGNAYDEALKKGDIASCIHMMIDFLKDPNSTSPYIDSTYLYMMQDIPEDRLKTASDMDFFDRSFYSSLPFSQALYTETLNNKIKEIKDNA